MTKKKTILVELQELKNQHIKALRKLEFMIEKIDNTTGENKLKDQIYNNVFSVVYKIMNVNKEEIQSKSRKPPIPDARKIFAALAHYQCNRGVVEISNQIKCDHSTVINMLKQHGTFIEVDAYYKTTWQKAKETYLKTI